MTSIGDYVWHSSTQRPAIVVGVYSPDTCYTTYDLVFLDDREQIAATPGEVSTYLKNCFCPGCKNVDANRLSTSEELELLHGKPKYLSPFTGQWV